MVITHLYLESSDPDRKDEITTYDLSFDQRFDDRSGKPVGKPMLSNISIHISRSSEEDMPAYVEWQLNPVKAKDLDIAFYADNQLKRAIKIKQAYLVSYHQSCSIPGTINETLVISPSSVEIEGEEFSREEKQ